MDSLHPSTRARIVTTIRARVSSGCGSHSCWFQLTADTTCCGAAADTRCTKKKTVMRDCPDGPKGIRARRRPNPTECVAPFGPKHRRPIRNLSPSPSDFSIRRTQSNFLRFQRTQPKLRCDPHRRGFNQPRSAFMFYYPGTYNLLITIAWWGRSNHTRAQGNRNCLLVPISGSRVFFCLSQ
jgi:hypothetical protein